MFFGVMGLGILKGGMDGISLAFFCFSFSFDRCLLQ
jgi:hypothetical protein